ncbi:MAG: hypothetical protein LBV02_06750 [Bacteroidales bacterium]|jgi:hypothetical protein|nr:hypothetical protein [Bacteroidales bacterium]
MKKIKFIIMGILLPVGVFALIFSCQKDESNTLLNDIQSIPKNEKMAIARLTENNEIVHLFLQKDVQEFFSKESSAVYGSSSKNISNASLVFVEVKDDNKNDKDAELLYRIYNDESKVTETSISTVLTLEDGIYYAQVGRGAQTVSCTTSNSACTQEVNGCVPYGTLCTKCASGGICTRTVTEVNAMVISAIIRSAH